jgi:hypothetical protein
MAKLNQIIAIEKGIKSRVYSDITDWDKISQKPQLFNGFSKEYRPIDTDGEALPPERQRVQYRVRDLLQSVERLCTEYFDITARKDWTNCTACADVKVNGQTILSEVPVPYLLFLEKQLTDLRTLIGRLPLLDEADDWKVDSSSGLMRTDEIKTHRTKKVQKPIVLYHATTEHPAQTQIVTEDILAGYWHQTKLSGAMARPDREKLTERVEALLQAVKQAREAANGFDEAEKVPSAGRAIFDYLYSGVLD